MINFDNTGSRVETFFWKVVLPVILVFLILLFGLKSCEKSKKIEVLQNQVDTHTFEQVIPFKQQRLHDSTLLILQDQLLVDKDSKLVKTQEELNKVKNLKSLVTYKTNIIIVHDTIEFTKDSKIIVVKDTADGKADSVECLTLPARVTQITKDFEIDESITSEGVAINYLNIPDSTTIVIGDSKKNIFSTQPVVKIKHSNKFLQTSDVKNLVIKDDKNKKVWKSFVIGGTVGSIATGVLIGLLHFYAH
jgi:hypothetical protein